MSTARAAFFIGLLCAASAASAAEALQWEPNNETFADWPTVSFSDGKKQRLLYYRRADAAKCAKSTKPRSCLVDLYDLNPVGDPTTIKSKKTLVTPTPRSNTGFTPPAFTLGETKEIDAKLTSYTTTLSNYKLEVNEKHLQVVQGEHHYDAKRNDAISTEGSQIFVLPPKAGAVLKDIAAKDSKPAAPKKTESNDQAPTERTANTPTEPKPAPAAESSLTELQKKALQAQAAKAAAAAYRRPPFDPEAKDQSGQFAPFMTEKELADYQSSLKGMSASRMLEFNIEQLRKITGRTPYMNEDSVTAANFEHLSPWEVERFCTNFHKGKETGGWKSKVCSQYAGKPMGGDAAADRLTAEELALLTPEERKAYNAILESQKGANPNGLAPAVADYRNLIKKEGRTKPYVQPKTKEEYAALEDWQKGIFCSRLPGAGAAATSSNTEFNPGTKDTKAITDLQDIAATNASQSAKPEKAADWAAEACALKKAGGDNDTTHPKHTEKSTVKGGIPKVPDLKPDQTPSGPNKWLKPEHLYNGAKGSLVGILLGSLGGPVGMMAGAAAGALFFYGLSMITSDKK